MILTKLHKRIGRNNPEFYTHITVPTREGSYREETAKERTAVSLRALKELLVVFQEPSERQVPSTIKERQIGYLGISGFAEYQRHTENSTSSKNY